MTREPPDRKRLKALRRGSLAEYRAALALLVKGYRIVAFRYRTKLGEIDIIARKGNLIACVEVKARRSLDDSVFAVSDFAQRRIRAASDLWLAKQPDFAHLSIRYDIISVTPWSWPVHLSDAF
ncbi:YraN family protein [Pararhizobium sp. BT-229]|uniref:YraN family protein n=1 Tax=Pararhizobium sp. BT-229 TaxID=2986923 RepID=UPI0021F6A6D7|nr:YraN family protein [Pararhizobium sp. BT-229]MCV9962354.1 YraN family protein [Pararhizobium sp. BT-229]